MRTLADVSLETGGLTVVIGENGTGKSSIIEAIEILRRASNQNFMQEVFHVHGGPDSLLRHGEHEIRFDISASIDGRACKYSIGMGEGQKGIVHEQLEHEESGVLYSRSMAHTDFSGISREDEELIPPDPKQLLLTSFGIKPPHEAMTHMANLLSRIDVHLPFNVQPGWAGRLTKRHSQLRESTYIQPAEKLDLFGSNLPNAWHELRSSRPDEHWQETMELVRLQMGDEVESIQIPAEHGGGSISLAIKYRNLDKPVPASLLSDGELSFLALVAMVRLGDHVSLLAIDEPDLHLHPKLIFRLVHMLEEHAEVRPVIITTHSDRLLDALDDPASSVRIIELDEDRKARLHGLDRHELEGWLVRYSGYGELRSSGYDRLVCRDVDADE